VKLSVSIVGDGDWDAFALLHNQVFGGHVRPRALRSKWVADYGAGGGAAVLVRDGGVPVAGMGLQFFRFDAGIEEPAIAGHIGGLCVASTHRGGEAGHMLFAGCEAYAAKRNCEFLYGVAHGGSLWPLIGRYDFQQCGTIDVFAVDTGLPPPKSWARRHARRFQRAAVGAVLRSRASSDRIAAEMVQHARCDGVHDMDFNRTLRPRGIFSFIVAGHRLELNLRSWLSVRSLPDCDPATLAEILSALGSLGRRVGAGSIRFMVDRREPMHTAVCDLVGQPQGSLYTILKPLGSRAPDPLMFRHCLAHTDVF
jgi:hypothetical protein